jgi:hypothetical protein
MDWTYFHLTTNHFPVIGAIFGFVVLGWGILRHNDSVSSVGLGITIFTALIAIPVYLTGEPAEDKVENLPGVLETMIESHEDFAMFALIAAIVSGIAAIVTLAYIRIRKEGSIGRGFMLATLLLLGLTVAAMGWTAKLGGVIRHTEIRDAGTQSAPAKTEQERGRDDDH